MPLKKDYKFEEDLVQAANHHFAFSHPARITILKMLLKTPFITYQECCERIPLSSGTTSQHLLLLRRLGYLVPTELPDGKSGYKLCHDMLNDAEALCKHLGLRAA